MLPSVRVRTAYLLVLGLFVATVFTKGSHLATAFQIGRIRLVTEHSTRGTVRNDDVAYNLRAAQSPVFLSFHGSDPRDSLSSRGRRRHTVTTAKTMVRNHDDSSSSPSPSPDHVLFGAVTFVRKSIMAFVVSFLVLTCGSISWQPLSPSKVGVTRIPPTAVAAVAPLADVGLREYLVKDGNQFLRLTLPTSLPSSVDPELLGDTGRVVQQSVELVRLRLEQVGFSGKTMVWNEAAKDVNKAKSLISTPDMVKNISTKQNREKAQILVEQSKEVLEKLLAACRKQDIESTRKLQEEASSLIYEIRVLSLPSSPGVLPYTIPSEYARLPQLHGRATVECILQRGSGSSTYTLEDESKVKEIKLTLVVDGYHAPLTSGNFVDLVQRKFYDDMPLVRVEELLVQTGRPGGSTVDGFIDPATKEKRTIPLELFYKGDKQPTYEYTSDDDMRATESFALPFQAYGALGMEHDEEENVNSASSQFWFLKWNQNLIAPSRNTLDGSHTCFGYVIKNQDLLSQVQKSDRIVRMTVLDGAENLFVNGKQKST